MNQYSRVALLLLIVIVLNPLMGCLLVAVDRLGTIKEESTPQSIILGSNGDIAIKTVSNYSHVGAFDRMKRVRINQSRKRYLIFKADFIRNYVENTTHTVESTIFVKNTYVAKMYPSKAPHYWYAEIYPKSFRAPDVDLCKAPAGFKSGGITYDINAEIPYKIRDEVVYISFTQLKNYPTRVHARWWRNYAYAPAIAVDATIIAAYFPVILVFSPVAIAIGAYEVIVDK